MDWSDETIAIGKLKPKQKDFCIHYLAFGNATKAAIMAGYDAKYAGTNADKLLKNTNVSAYLEAQNKQMDPEKIAPASEVLETLTATMRGEKQEEIPILNGKGKQKLVKKQVGVKEQLKAAELLGKRYGLFTENVKLEGQFPIVISGEDALED